MTSTIISNRRKLYGINNLEKYVGWLINKVANLIKQVDIILKLVSK